MPSVIVPLNTYPTTLFGKPTSITFIDSTQIAVCHIIRAKRNKVFNRIAEHRKGTMECFFGFKLHLIVNQLGDVLNVKITGKNVDDRKPVLEIVKALSGNLYLMHFNLQIKSLKVIVNFQV